MRFKTITLALATILLLGTASSLTIKDYNLTNNTTEGSGDLEEVDSGKYILTIDRSEYDSSALKDLGVSIRYEYSIIDGVAVEMPEDAVSSVEQLEFVEKVEEDLVTNLPVLEGESSESESESYSGGDGKVIAVLDTGIDTDHVDLDEEVVHSKDFTGSGPEDRHGHGSHVAGIAAGTGEGNPDYRGVAPDTSLMNVKVLNDDGSGRASDAIKGIEYAVENNADVITMSLGVQTECDGEDALSRAADNAVEQGVPTVVSAGNKGPDSQTITSPGCGHKVLTVGASQNKEEIARFSSRGETDDGRIKPNIAAPGVNVYAPEAQTENRYTSKSGTSMSAPYVAGAVALLQSDEPGREPSYYFKILTKNTFTLGESPTAEGDGRVNITAALNRDGTKESTDNGRSEEKSMSGDGEVIEKRESSLREKIKRWADEKANRTISRPKESHMSGDSGILQRLVSSLLNLFNF